MSTVYLFYSSVSGSMKIKQEQAYIENILTGKKIPFELVDIATNDAKKNLLKEAAEKSGKPAVPPKVFVGDELVADYEDIMNANENETLTELLHIAP